MRFAVLALVGCAPQLGRLVDDHNYREAICAADDGDAGDRAFVTRAIARDAHALVHVAIVQPPHIARVLGDDDPAIDKLRFARVRLQLDAIPVDAVEATASIRDARGSVAAFAITRESLVAVTGETLPPHVRYSSYMHTGTLWRVVGAIFTAGMSLPFTRFSEREFVREAPDDQFRTTAPRAHALFHALPSGGCRVVTKGAGKGLACQWFVSLAERPGPLGLHVDVAYTAKRERYGSCVVRSSTKIALGSSDGLALTTSRRFGSRMRPLAAE